MQEITIQAEVRNQVGKNLGNLRRRGKIPGIFYSAGEPNIPIAISEKSLKPLIFSSTTSIINLVLDNNIQKRCILREIQYDPVTDVPIHFDVQGLQEDRNITLEVPIVVTGETPIGVREGGILQKFMHKIKISCLPKYIPDHIEINAENLKINQFIHVRDLQISNVTIIENEFSTIVGVIPPVVEKEPTPTAAVVEEVAEPEIIAKGKKAEEEGEEKPESGKSPETAPKQ